MHGAGNSAIYSGEVEYHQCLSYDGHMIALVWTGISLALWGLLKYTFKQDRSRYRNCIILFFALIVTVFAFTFYAGPNQKYAIVLIVIITSLVLLIVPLFLIHNGILMIWKEGFRIPNLLSLTFGILIGIGEICTFFWLFFEPMMNYQPISQPEHRVILFIAVFISVSVIYLSVSFLIFMIYSLFLQIIPRKNDFDYLIIHGAGLINGDRVSRLLADRLDKAVEVYQKDPTPPILIPSGGQGADEKISEAEAMAAYLREKGIPEEKIILENQSSTTMENLIYSKAIIDARKGPKYTALVTSNYHVYRALRYCRKVGLDCTGIGSRVAFYYWPSALIREFIAVHAEKKHLIYLIGGWVLSIALAIYVMRYRFF